MFSRAFAHERVVCLVHKMLQIVKKDAQDYSESCSKNLNVAPNKKLLITQPKNHFLLFLDS